MMSFGPELLAVLVILIFGLVIFLMIRASRTQAAEKQQLAKALGFEPVAELPGHLATRVEELFQGPDPKPVFIDQVYQRRELDRELFIFDVSRSTGDSSELGSEIFGVISRELALPRFSLITLPGFDSSTLLGGLMDKLLDKVLEIAEKHQGLSRIEFPDRPEFQDQVIVFGRDPQAVRTALDKVQFRALNTGRSPLQIAGSGDFLTVDFSLPSSSGSEDTDLISQYQQFSEILQAFTK